MEKRIAALSEEIVKVLKFNPELSDDMKARVVALRIEQLSFAPPPPAIEVTDYTAAVAALGKADLVQAGVN